MAKNIVVYDLEIKNNPNELETRWSDFSKFGISVLCLYDSLLKKYLFFDDKNYGDFILSYWTKEDVCLVSYNGLAFDNKVIETNWIINHIEAKLTKKASEIDIYNEIKEKLGRFQKGTSLDSVCYHTIGKSKSGSGIMAPLLFRENRIAELFSYCLSDVQMTKELFEHIIKSGFIYYGPRDSDSKGSLLLQIAIPS